MTFKMRFCNFLKNEDAYLHCQMLYSAGKKNLYIQSAKKTLHVQSAQVLSLLFPPKALRHKNAYSYVISYCLATLHRKAIALRASCCFTAS